MYIRYLGFLLLIWFPGVHAQPCIASNLEGGYFVPEEKTYLHETSLTYACNEGLKPAVEGWWATSTCQNGTWSHEPRCIDKDACFSQDIPNAKYEPHPKHWYENGSKIRITCQKGYKLKDRNATAKCENGTWSSVLVCEKSLEACGVPPKIPHAVIINQGYQDVFAVDSVVQYECEDGYTVKGEDTNKTIICISGKWTKATRCRSSTTSGLNERDSRPRITTTSRVTSTDTRQSGSAVGGTGGGHSTSAGSGTQPADRGTRPDTEHGSRKHPAGGGSSTTSGLNERDSRPRTTTTIDYCGEHPNVPNADVVQTDQMFLKYKCNVFYTQDGSDTVVCYSDGTWSQLPVCQEAFCVIDPAQFVGGNFKLSGAEYMREGERKNVPCTWRNYSSFFQCTDGKISVTQCCHYYDHNRGVCTKLQQLFG